MDLEKVQMDGRTLHVLRTIVTEHVFDPVHGQVHWCDWAIPIQLGHSLHFVPISWILDHLIDGGRHRFFGDVAVGEKRGPSFVNDCFGIAGLIGEEWNGQNGNAMEFRLVHAAQAAMRNEQSHILVRENVVLRQPFRNNHIFRNVVQFSVPFP